MVYNEMVYNVYRLNVNLKGEKVKSYGRCSVKPIQENGQEGFIVNENGTEEKFFRPYHFDAYQR